MKRFITYLSVLVFSFCLIPGCTYAVGVGHSGVSGTATTIPGDFNIKGLTTLGIKGASGGTADPSSKLVMDGTGDLSIQFLSSGAAYSGEINFGDSTSPTRGQIIYSRSNNYLTFYTNSLARFYISPNGISTQGATGGVMGAGTINAAGMYVNGTNNQSFRAHIFAAGTADFYPTGWGVISHTGTGAYNITLQSGFALYDATTAQAITCTASSPNVGVLPTYAAVTAPYHSATNIVYINTYYNGAAYDLGADITCFAN